MLQARAKKEIQKIGLSKLLSKAIWRARIALDLSVPELAKKIGKSHFFCHKLERNDIVIDAQTLQDCACAFGLSVGELVELAFSGDIVVLVDKDN